MVLGIAQVGADLEIHHHSPGGGNPTPYSPGGGNPTPSRTLLLAKPRVAVHNTLRFEISMVTMLETEVAPPKAGGEVTGPYAP